MTPKEHVLRKILKEDIVLKKSGYKVGIALLENDGYQVIDIIPSGHIRLKRALTMEELMAEAQELNIPLRAFQYNISSDRKTMRLLMISETWVGSDVLGLELGVSLSYRHAPYINAGIVRVKGSGQREYFFTNIPLYGSDALPLDQAVNTLNYAVKQNVAIIPGKELHLLLDGRSTQTYIDKKKLYTPKEAIALSAEISSQWVATSFELPRLFCIKVWSLIKTYIK